MLHIFLKKNNHISYQYKNATSLKLCLKPPTNEASRPAVHPGGPNISQHPSLGNAGVHKWGYPNSWMVFVRENPNQQIDDN